METAWRTAKALVRSGPDEYPEIVLAHLASRPLRRVVSRTVGHWSEGKAGAESRPGRALERSESEPISAAKLATERVRGIAAQPRKR